MVLSRTLVSDSGGRRGVAPSMLLSEVAQDSVLENSVSPVAPSLSVRKIITFSLVA